MMNCPSSTNKSAITGCAKLSALTFDCCMRPKDVNNETRNEKNGVICLCDEFSFPAPKRVSIRYG